MSNPAGARSTSCGFTLIELLIALLMLSILALMSYRGLGAVLDAREHIAGETGKWRQVSVFLMRFERDVQMAAPRPVRTVSGSAPAWLARPDTASHSLNSPQLEFSRFASTEGIDAPRRIAYRLNERQEIELWLWSGLDMPPDALPERYPVLMGVEKFELKYLNASFAWVDAWPTMPSDTPIPRAVKLRITLASGEEIMRIFALHS
ncbi:MAG TPA: type II secretion system minor pseudopilin GspJ [Gallionella sp.]|nr:type II secretion system minor pseudopilin GspJ [Gallionella sp.]